MDRLSVTKSASAFFFVNSILNAICLRELGFLASMILAGVFAAATLIIEEIRSDRS